MTACASCGQAVAVVAGRWVHVTPSRVGLRPRPTFVGCDATYSTVAEPAPQHGAAAA